MSIMARILHKDILEHFLETFMPDKVLTSSEYKMQSIKLSQLKKSVKKYIEEADIKTDKSAEKIIMEAITYAGMSGRRFTSIASIGYDILPKSIAYWAKMDLLKKKKEEEAKEKEKQLAEATKQEEAAMKNNAKMSTVKKVPKWMNLSDDDE